MTTWARLVEARQRRREHQDLYGKPGFIASSSLGLVLELLRHGRAGRYLWESKRIQGWIRGSEAVELWDACLALNGAATVVEIGAFLGCSTALLAGARKMRGTGTVHTVDPFTGSGDPFSVSIYHEIASASSSSLRERFDANMRRAGVSDFLHVHQATAADAVRDWAEPIDLLYLDGDQSPAGARETFQSWTRFLREGGTLVINNTAEGAHPPEHDGSVRLVREFLKAPQYEAVRSIEALTFARRSRWRAYGSTEPALANGLEQHHTSGD